MDKTARGHNIEIARLKRHNLLMLRIRALEEVAIRAQKEKLVLGAIHPYIGQEAIAAGVMASLANDDLLLSNHRGHGHTLAKGASSEAMIRELLGRVGGTCQGKGGSMHIADFGIGMLGANGVVAANIVIATGAAHAIKLRKENRVVVCFFGDGAINRGPFLEGLNWAQVFQLPVLFVCENNRYAATTRTSDMTGGPGATARARSLGIVSEDVDGNDVIAIEDLAVRFVREIKAGGGPRMLHAHTYRLTGHTAVDVGAYRPPNELENERAHDPIRRIADLLVAAGVAQNEIEADREAARIEMDGAYERAVAASFPDGDTAFMDVQDMGDPRVEAF